MEEKDMADRILLEATKTKSGLVIYETLQKVQKDTKDFLRICYEIRKQDDKYKYTNIFLSEDYVKKGLVVDIALSNYYDKEENQMMVKDNAKYRLMYRNNHIL